MRFQLNVSKTTTKRISFDYLQSYKLLKEVIEFETVFQIKARTITIKVSKYKSKK